MKKVYFLIGGVILTVLLAIFYPNDLKHTVCGSGDVDCRRIFNLIRIIFLLGPALLVTSLASLKTSSIAFESWKKTTLYFIPIYVIIILLMPWSVGDEIAGFTKGMLGLVLCIGYAFSSVIYLLKNRQKT